MIVTFSTSFNANSQDQKTGLSFSDELNIMIGMANISFTENQSTLTGPNISEPASGSISSINALIHYRFKNESSPAWFFQTNFPLISGTTGNYLSGGGGIEFTWGETSGRSVLKDYTTSLTISPVTRYFVGLGANIAYIAYVTETAKKSDTLLELGAHGGISRKVGNYHLRAQAGVDRGVGFTSTTLGMKALLGITLFLN